jgi:hypothetical protein
MVRGRDSAKNAELRGTSDCLNQSALFRIGFMSYQIKVLRGLDRGDYVIILARGAVDIAGFEQILDKLIDASESLLDCKVLVDFQDCKFTFLPPDTTEFLVWLELKRWPHNCRIAFISAPDEEQYRHLAILGEGLLKINLQVGVFYEMREAIDWLSSTRSR